MDWLTSARSKKRTFEERLDRGYDLCQTEPEGQKKEELEAFWIDLLRKYQILCDSIAAREAQPA